MRRYLLLAAVAAMAALTALATVPASAATIDVLTTGKVGGTNVATGAVLKASLASGTTANFFQTATGTCR